MVLVLGIEQSDSFLNICVCVCVCVCVCMLSCSVMSDSFDPMDCSPPGSSVHVDSPGKNTGVVCHALLQGILPTLGLNPHLSHCRQILYCLSHQGSPRILEWVACLFSRGSFQPRNWTGVSCIAGGLFTSWVVHTYLFFFQVTLHYRLLQDIE